MAASSQFWKYPRLARLWSAKVSQRVWGCTRMVSIAAAASTTTRAGSSRRARRLRWGHGESEASGVSAVRSSELPKKKPDRTRKTSTPPDTRPNQIWKTATKAIAIPRSPSRSCRYVTAGRGGVAGGSVGAGALVADGRNRVKVDMIAR